MSDESKIGADKIRNSNRLELKASHPIFDALDIRTGYSNGILVRMVIIGLAVSGIIFWQAELISNIYSYNQTEGIGLVINGGIITLFSIGIIRLVITLLRYGTEETAVALFIKNTQNNIPDPTQDLPTNSIIYKRYRLMQGMYEQRALVNHSALASMLLAKESTCTSMVRFINNILILAGVFGTIVSLSIALLGASSILDASANTNGMSQVLSGMSMALSTTITAIICYLYFGYFVLKLSDVQTNIINNIEQLTAALLIPKFSLQTDTIMQDVATLTHKMQKLVSTLEETQARYSASGQKLLDAVSNYNLRGQTISGDLGAIKELLRSGFRLYENNGKKEA